MSDKNAPLRAAVSVLNRRCLVNAKGSMFRGMVGHILRIGTNGGHDSRWIELLFNPPGRNPMQTSFAIDELELLED